MHWVRRAALLVGAAILPLSSASAETAPEPCSSGKCVYRLTAEQMVAQAEALVRAGDYEAAKPLVAAMAQAPQLNLQRRFLAGFIASETGDLDGAVKNFRAILEDDPSQTRVRLELARALLLQGKEAAADHHLRLAQEADDLPDEIERTIRSTRGIIRDRRVWNVNVTVGLAPDTNINNGANADKINVRFGPWTLPLTLDSNARRKSGLGVTAGVSAGVRLRVDEKLALLLDLDGQIVTYKGKRFDDHSVQLAAGPEYKLSETSSVSLQAVGLQRWYGGDLVLRQYGLKAGYQQLLSQGQRLGFQLDARRSDSRISPAYDGWQLAAYATYERVLRRSMVASATLHVRRDDLEDDDYSMFDYGIDLGIGGELPMGINAGLSGGISRVDYDEAIYLFSDNPRGDWRFSARAYVGLRSVKLLGFSPSLTYTYGRIETNYDLYKTDRHRVRFDLARFF
jgi:hypothetical protein